MSDDRTVAPLSRIVLASNNAGKLREFTALFSTVGIEIVPQGDLAVPEAEEPFGTFIENALTKARHASRLTGLPAIADDSGLCVRTLRGAPGVCSARYAQRAGRDKGDAANNAKLLEALKDVPAEQRGAQFVCVLALVRHAEDPLPILCEGLWHGRILFEASGEHGFGYDPLFWVPERNCSSADLAPVDKNQLSHRARAMALLRQRLGLA